MCNTSSNVCHLVDQPATKATHARACRSIDYQLNTNRHFGFILPRHQLVASRGRFPGYRFRWIAIDILSQFKQLETDTRPLLSMNPMPRNRVPSFQKRTRIRRFSETGKHAKGLPKRHETVKPKKLARIMKLHSNPRKDNLACSPNTSRVVYLNLMLRRPNRNLIVGANLVDNLENGCPASNLLPKPGRRIYRRIR